MEGKQRRQKGRGVSGRKRKREEEAGEEKKIEGKEKK